MRVVVNWLGPSKLQMERGVCIGNPDKPSVVLQLAVPVGSHVHYEMQHSHPQMALDTAICHVGTLLYYVCLVCNSLTEGDL